MSDLRTITAATLLAMADVTKRAVEASESGFSPEQIAGARMGYVRAAQSVIDGDEEGEALLEQVRLHVAGLEGERTEAS